MILNMTGGGASPFAFILVTYPEGSTVTCTNSSGKKDISDTQRLFYIKKGVVPFNCVVTAIDGTHTATKTVSIEYEGQGENIALAYDLILFDSNVESGWEHKNRVSGYGTAAIESGKIHLKGHMASGSASNLYTCLFYHTNSVEKADYTTLKIDVDSVTTGSGVYLIVQTTPKAIDINGSQDGAPVAQVALTAAGTFSLEYPSGDYYVGILCSGTSEAYVSKVWLE